jgi:hypothetical protein
MSNERKRDLIRAYRERKPRRGVFALRCAPSAQIWVSASPNLDTQQNGTWFSLRTGSHPNRELQSDWKTHGEGAFSYEILAELAEQPTSAYAQHAELKTLEEEWRARLSAGKVTG